MSQPEAIVLLSDSDDDNEDNFINNDFATPLSNHLKRNRSTSHHFNSQEFINLDPTPPSKLHKSASSTTSFVPETPFSDSPKLIDPPVATNLPISSSISPLNLSGDDELICMGSDDEAGGLARGTCLKNIGACAGVDVGNGLDRSPKCAVKEKQLETQKLVPDVDVDSWLDIDSTVCLHKGVDSSNVHGESVGLGKRRSTTDGRIFPDHYVEWDLEKRPKLAAKENCQENKRITATFNVECLEKCPIVQSTCHRGNSKSTKTYDPIYMEVETNQIQPIEDLDCDKENVGLERRGAISKPKSGDDANAGKKQNKDKQTANRKKSMEGKRLTKEQEKLRKADLKAEAAKLKQLEKEKKKLEKYKFSEKDIEADIDPMVLSGSLGGHLLSMFDQKHLTCKINPNPIKKSIVWRMKLPEGISQLPTVKKDIHYILLIYDDAEEFCNHANDGSLLDHISSVRKHYPTYTICFLTNRLMSFINKREQQKYKNQKVASDWKRPPIEELFAKLTTHFANVHSRQCVDEAEVAEHVVGLTINLAKCHSRKKLTYLSVNANGGNVTKDCVDRSLIMKHPWLKALVSIPKVQPRYAIAIWKKYPTMKSLLRVYMDPTVPEKESILADLPLEGLLGNETRLGEKCSKRVYRILMAKNGSIKTDDVEEGADYFPSQ